GLNLTITSCAHCGEPREDVLHVLFRCSKAKEDIFVRGEFSCKSAYLLAIETSQELVQNNSNEALKIFHAIWMAKGLVHIVASQEKMCYMYCSDAQNLRRRNKHFHGQAERKEVAVEVMAKRLLLDYFNANKKEIARRVETPQTSSRNVWMKQQAPKLSLIVTQLCKNSPAKWAWVLLLVIATEKCYFQELDLNSMRTRP
nr:hypothetical protein [Tanacetum cinerariifolium]